MLKVRVSKVDGLIDWLIDWLVGWLAEGTHKIVFIFQYVISFLSALFFCSCEDKEEQDQCQVQDSMQPFPLHPEAGRQGEGWQASRISSTRWAKTVIFVE